jgi:hypothetical protein
VSAPRVFVSYRRDDSSGHAGRLHDSLAARFGPGNVFMDVASIEPGTDFVAAIEQAVNACDVLVGVIGRLWLDASDAQGMRRLDDPNDFVRLELASARRGGVRILPVLVQGAQMPKAEDLPEELAALARLQAHELSDSRWHSDLESLLLAIEQRKTEGAPRTNLLRPATELSWAGNRNLKSCSSCLLFRTCVW